MRALMSSLWNILKQSRAMIVLAFISAFFSVAATLIAPFLIGRILDAIVKDGLSASFTLLLGLLLTYLFGTFCLFVLNRSSNKIAYQSVHTLRSKMYHHLMQLPLSFFDNRPLGDTMSRFVNDVDSVFDGMLQGLLSLFQGIMTIIGCVALMLYVDSFMALIVMLSAPITYVVAKKITKRSQQYFFKQAQDVGELSAFAEELIEGQKTLQAFQRQETAYEEFQEKNNTLYDSGFHAQFLSSLSNPTTRIVNNILYAVIGVVGGLRALQGLITVGDISSFLIYASIFGKPFNDLTSVYSQIQAAFASLKRIVSLLDEPKQNKDKLPLEQVLQQGGDVSFKDVSFSYSKDKSLIEHLDLHIPYGSHIAIVGETGAGKTTLMHLLLRFYDVTSGSITIEGVNIEHLKKEDLRRMFGMVLQDSWLFEGSIKDNIAYGKPQADLDEIIQAATLSGAHGFVSKLEHGYDTQLTKQASTLSQGQKQLLSIARVMLVNPSILLLDEATSNIDTYSEQKIQQAFAILSKGKTSFVIAHRLSTIQSADLILVMKDGHVIEQGNHKELIVQDGHYAKMYKSQFSH